MGFLEASLVVPEYSEETCRIRTALGAMKPVTVPSEWGCRKGRTIQELFQTGSRSAVFGSGKQAKRGKLGSGDETTVADGQGNRPPLREPAGHDCSHHPGRSAKILFDCR